jgi:transposase-like protein
MLNPVLLLMQVIVFCAMVYVMLEPQQVRQSLREAIEQTRQRWQRARRPRARSSAACVECSQPSPGLVEHRPAPRPYGQVKSRRGRRKKVNSNGYACLHPDCAYYLITDSTVHALVSDGKRGVNGDIQRWLCRACGHSYSARRGTLLWRLKTPAQTVQLAIHLLCLGLDRSSVAQVVGVDADTVALWLERSGAHAARMHQHFLRNLTPSVLQLDELQAVLRGVLKRVWVWLAIDPSTKLIVSLHVGSRKTACAMRFVHQLRHTLAAGHLPLFLSDGLNAYFYALTAHFGTWRIHPRSLRPFWQVQPGLVYAQVLKITRWRRLLRTFPRALCGSLVTARQHLQTAGFCGIIQTAFMMTAGNAEGCGSISPFVMALLRWCAVPGLLTAPRRASLSISSCFVPTTILCVLIKLCPARSSLARLPWQLV